MGDGFVTVEVEAGHRDALPSWILHLYGAAFMSLGYFATTYILAGVFKAKVPIIRLQSDIFGSNIKGLELP